MTGQTALGLVGRDDPSWIRVPNVLVSVVIDTGCFQLRTCEQTKRIYRIQGRAPYVFVCASAKTRADDDSLANCNSIIQLGKYLYNP